MTRRAGLAAGTGEELARKHLQGLLDDATRSLVHAPAERDLFTTMVRTALRDLDEHERLLEDLHANGRDVTRIVRVTAPPRPALLSTANAQARALHHLCTHGWLEHPYAGTYRPATGRPFGTNGAAL